MDWFDPSLALAGLGIGVIVGMTGMGGGALMTPVLVFFFNVNPLTAISSDLVVSLFMKPAGAIVHLRRKTVNLQLVTWLCFGSVPAAFCGVLVLQALPGGESLNTALQRFLGIALLVATAGLVTRAWIGMVQYNRPFGEGPTRLVHAPDVVVRPVPTMVLGAAAGFMVGITSVGAGSVIIVVLLMLYPAIKASQLVGTDLVQAIPLVAAASLAHLFYGDFSATIAGSVLVGAIPGAWLGAQFSTRAPGGLIRRALAVLLLASGLKLLGASPAAVLISAIAAVLLGNVGWILARRRVIALAKLDAEALDPPHPPLDKRNL
ncbi:sulfite exporter TauE/SafE family protein [soil metagenome]